MVQHTWERHAIEENCLPSDIASDEVCLTTQADVDRFKIKAFGWGTRALYVGCAV